MDYRNKIKEHDRWIAAAKALCEFYHSHNIESFNPEVNMQDIIHNKQDACPQCECRDEGNRFLGIHPKEIKGGKYQLRIICYLCLEEGKVNLKWSEIGKENVIRILADRFYYQHPEREGTA